LSILLTLLGKDEEHPYQLSEQALTVERKDIAMLQNKPTICSTKIHISVNINLPLDPQTEVLTVLEGGVESASEV
jgi:hypothetical protein